MESVKNEVQASDQAIDAYLKKLHAITVDGFWILIIWIIHLLIFVGYLRLLDFDYRTKLIEYILSILSIQDWSKDNIPIEICAMEMKEICPK